MRDDFVVLILSHGRASSLRRYTVGSLQKSGYTGDWFIVLDSGDTTFAEYAAEFGEDRIVVFDKDDTDTDMGDNGGSQGVIIYARNAAAKIAAERGYRYYMQLDDDYFWWLHRFEGAPKKPGSKEPSLRSTTIRDLDGVFEALVDYLETSDALTVAMCQGGDLLGGVHGGRWTQGLLRKAMNTFIARTDRPLRFVGRINEDVNTYVSGSIRGELFLTLVDVQVLQEQTQANTGGMSGAYLEAGTYMKSFYSVMYAPSAVKIRTMGANHQRLHHGIRWENAAPKILSDKWQKPRASKNPATV